MRWVVVVVALMAFGCGHEDPAPRSVAVPVVSPASDSPKPDAAAPPLASATGADPMTSFVHAGYGDVEPVDPGVVASADQPLIKAASDRAEACVKTHKGPLRLRLKVTLADDGAPSAELRAVDGTLTAPESKCVLDALSRGRYTKPGTPVGSAVTKRFFNVRVESGLDMVD